MTTKFNDNVQFASTSIVDGYIGIGQASIASAINYSISNFSAADRSLDATETTPANIAATVATLISDLYQKGVLVSDGGE